MRQHVADHSESNTNFTMKSFAFAVPCLLFAAAYAASLESQENNHNVQETEQDKSLRDALTVVCDAVEAWVENNMALEPTELHQRLEKLVDETLEQNKALAAIEDEDEDARPAELPRGLMRMGLESRTRRELTARQKPAIINHHRRPAAGPAPDQPTGTGLSLFGALVTYHREAMSARWPLGHALILLTTPWPGDHAYLGNSSLAPYLATHPSILRSRSADSFSQTATRLSHQHLIRPKRPGYSAPSSAERQEGEPKVVKDLTEKEFRSEMREIVKYILKHYKDVTPVSLCQRLRDFFETGVGQPKITCGEGDRS
ncbi:hypothetical protein MTO96_030275 [Rhipicephalus appendiculatus]